jgi:hypothetical protein
MVPQGAAEKGIRSVGLLGICFHIAALASECDCQISDYFRRISKGALVCSMRTVDGALTRDKLLWIGRY